MTELLPCPFCGGEAETWYDGALWHVICKSENCAAMSSPRFTEAEAIAAWNNRAGCVRCRIEWQDELPYLVCSNCGAIQPEDHTVYFCWSCGAKVVSE